MRPKRYTEEQIIYALTQADSGVKVAEITRTMGISEPTFYAWKKKHAGLGVSIQPSKNQARRRSFAVWCSLHSARWRSLRPARMRPK